MIESILSIGSWQYYSSQLTREYNTEIQLISINPPSGFAIIRSLNGNSEEIDNYINALRNRKEIIEVDITHKEDNIYWTRAIHQLEEPSIHDTILETNSMSIFPIIIKNGLQLHKIYSPTPNSFRNLIGLLKSRFDTVEVQSVTNRPSISNPSGLTEKQIEAIIIALEKGYYEIPKEVSILNLANEIGISKSAFQERVQRAEKNIISNFVKNLSLNK